MSTLKPIPDSFLENFLPFSMVDLSVASRTLWGEARGEILWGQIAQVWVVKNRSLDKSERWPTTIRGVCLQPKQFSCWNSNDPNSSLLPKLTLQDEGFRALIQVTFSVLLGTEWDLTYGSNHYHSKNMTTFPNWSVGHTPKAIFGNHIFYRL